MESSEESSCDGPLDPDNSSNGYKNSVFISGEDVYQKFLLANKRNLVDEVLDNNATLVLDNHKFELSRKNFMFARGSNNEILVILEPGEPSNECTLSQPASENLDNIDILEPQQRSNNMGAVSNEGIQVIEKNDVHNTAEKATLHIEPSHVDSNKNPHSSKVLDSHVQKEGCTVMVFNPEKFEVIPVDNTTGYVQVDGVIQPADEVSEPCDKEEIECVRKGSEESVISQMDLDSFSSTVDDIGVSVVNIEDNKNNFHNEHMAAEIEASSIMEKDGSSILCMPPQDIDLAVSDFEITALTLAGDQDLRTENIQESKRASEIVASSSMLSVPPQDIDLVISDAHLTALAHADGQNLTTNNIQEDKNEIEETDQLEIALSAVSTNVSYVECSNLKKSLDSKLFSESSLTREASNHSYQKSGADSSNKYNSANDVEKTMDVDTNESMHFPLCFPSDENIVDGESKWKNSINCNNSDSYKIEEYNENLDNKICPSSKTCKNKMDFINSGEACSEKQTCSARMSSSFKDNSKTKNFSSGNVQPIDCNLQLFNKLKSVSPCKIKDINEYNFENSLDNLDQELIRNSSLDMQSSDDISTKVDATKVSQLVNLDLDVVTRNLTFQGILTPVSDHTELNENLVDSKNSETCTDNSQYLFHQVPQHNEDHSSSKIFKSTSEQFFKNKQNLLFNEVNYIDADQKSNENILGPNNDSNIDNNSDENDCMLLNIHTSDETTIKQPQKTYIRKKENLDSIGNIELFSGGFSDNESHSSSSNIFCINTEQEQVIDKDGLTDEDGYGNLIPSYFKNKFNVPCNPVEKRTTSLRPEASDHLLKNPDPVLDGENLASTCGVSIDKNSKENERMYLNIAADETTVIPPQRTYIRKKRNSDSDRNVELFSDDFSDNQPYLAKTCLENEQEQIITDEYSLPDEDGYVNLIFSNLRNRTKAQSTHADKKTSLRSEFSDHVKKVPDPVACAKDLTTTCGIDNKSKENDGMFIHLSASDETTIKPSPRTYIRKRMPSNFVRNSENEQFSTPDTFCINNEQEQIMIDEDNLTDEDGYVNLMPSCLKSRIKTQTNPEEKRSIKSKLSDLVKIPDPFIDVEDSISTFSASIDYNSKENNSLYLNLSASNENTVKPPQRTCIQKKKTSESFKIIELFSDGFSDNEPSSPKTYIDNEQEQIMIDEYSLPDEDGYVNLMPSYFINGVKAPSIQVDERMISLRPESSDHLHLITIPDTFIDAEDSVNICCDSDFFIKSFKPVNAEKLEEDAPKSSSYDLSKVKSSINSLRKRVQTPSYEKINSNVGGYKNSPLCNKLIKDLSVNIKNSSSVKRKVRIKYKRNLKNSKYSPGSMVHKIGQSSKDVKKSECLLHSVSSLPERMNNCNIRFLNDNSTEKNSCEIYHPSKPSTATQKLKNVQYNCWNCNFTSTKVNNLIMHLKYCVFKSSADMMDHDMEEQIPSIFSGSFLELDTSSSDGSFSLNKYSASHSTTSEGFI